MDTSSFGRDCQKIVNTLMTRFKTFTVFDVAAFKVLLISIGAIIGMYCSKVLKKFAPVVFIIFAASYIYIIFKIFLKPIIKNR